MIVLSGEPQNRKQELVSGDRRRFVSASSAAVIERRHLLHDNTGTNEAIQFNLRWAIGVLVCPYGGHYYHNSGQRRSQRTVFVY